MLVAAMLLHGPLQPGPQNHLRGLAKEQFVDRLAHYNGELNKLLPFREGNLAAKLSFAGDLQAVKEIFRDAVRPTRALAFEQLPRDEAVAKHPELPAAYGSLDALRHALAKQYPGNDQAPAHFLRQARSEVLRRLDSGKTLEIPGRAVPAASKAEGPVVAKRRGPDVER